MQLSTALQTKSQRSHRTQAERREETRTALLDATVECLVTHGYARTTTGRIAEIAHVSRGAQTLYFRTRADLVGAAVAHLAEQRAAAVTDLFTPGSTSVAEALDALWAEHQGVMFHAALELWVAARTDPDLREKLHRLEREVGLRIAAAAQEALGDVARRDGFAEDLLVVLAAIRGLALLQLSNGGGGAGREHAWEQTRVRLARLLVHG